MSDSKNDAWMDRLAKKYRIPDETPSDRSKKKSILRQSQLKIINEGNVKNGKAVL